MIYPVLYQVFNWVSMAQRIHETITHNASFLLWMMHAVIPPLWGLFFAVSYSLYILIERFYRKPTTTVRERDPLLRSEIDIIDSSTATKITQKLIIFLKLGFITCLECTYLTHVDITCVYIITTCIIVCIILAYYLSFIVIRALFVHPVYNVVSIYFSTITYTMQPSLQNCTHAGRCMIYNDMPANQQNQQPVSFSFRKIHITTILPHEK